MSYLPGIGKAAPLDPASRIPLSAFSLPAALDLMLEFIAHVEVIFDRAFTSAGDETAYR